MRRIRAFNNGWTFVAPRDCDNHPSGCDGIPVTLPHNAIDIPLNYFDESAWWKRFVYRREFEYVPECDQELVSLVFDGVMANSVVYLNEKRIFSHRDGYTGFEVPLNGHLNKGKNQIRIVVDGSENPDIPPFGGQIDYLCYAGIYRDVWLKITDLVAIDSLKIETLNPLESTCSMQIACQLRGSARLFGNTSIRASLYDPNGTEIASSEAPALGGQARIEFRGLQDIDLWDTDSPNLYSVQCEVDHPHYCDSVRQHFGVREAVFRPEGFFLNGRKVTLRGLNRHQSYPYVGYAMGRRAQEKDAEILRYDLGCNLVRTSHYPQSPWFLDHCDRIGLMVFEEIPGWQHVGDRGWQEQALANVSNMVRRDWNHPSIIMWGVRINESADSHRFYQETNALARTLDPTRPTGGVRNICASEFLEDVYTMNDFFLGSEELPGANHQRTALRRRDEVTGLTYPVPYLITEFNGHMYPTKRTDAEDRQIEHVRRFLEVLNAAAGQSAVCGSIGWCLFDYNTHKDFGSGDRICHHGVLDIFRIPKLAAYVYASQKPPASGPVLKPVTRWTRGDRSIGGVVPLMVLTNCDRVDLHYGGALAATAGPDHGTYPWLDHPPVVFDHSVLLNQELGRWGFPWRNVVVKGYVEGEQRIEFAMVADPVPSGMSIKPDRTELLANEPDHVRVVVRVTDQVGNTLAYLDDPLDVEVSGAARLIGPDRLTLRGGATAFWIASIGKTGQVSIRVSTNRLPSLTHEMVALDGPARHVCR